MPSTPHFRLGKTPIYGDAVLAPMDGYSDLPFRSVCRELGSAISYTEFIHAPDVIHRPERVRARWQYLPWERPVVFQIYGSTPQMLLEAALRLQEFSPDAIDINMGCPDKRIVRRGAGAGLLGTPVKVARIIRLLSRKLEVPVTAKIRLGLDESCRNYLLIARIVEENGGSLLAVHGRTQAQGYKGTADWDAIAEIAQALSIPVLGNGDVRTPRDIERMKAHTGVEGVMIGRAAIRNPWIFTRRERTSVSRKEVWEVMSKHLNRNLQFYGQERGLILFRKHAAQYLAPYFLDNSQRRALLTTPSPQEFLALAKNLLFGDATIQPI